MARSGVRVGAVVTGLVLVLIASACVPKPKPGTLDIVGDSLAVQSIWNRDDAFYAEAPTGLDVEKDVRTGIGYSEVLEGQKARVQKERPAILVIALGTNNANAIGGGWTSSDDKALRDLMAAPHASTCEVLVLPGYSDKATVSAQYRKDLDLARAAMRKAAADRTAKKSPTVVADWGAVALAHPELTRADGIHLADDAPSQPDRLANEDAADAWAHVLWTGVAACPAPTPTPNPA